MLFPLDFDTTRRPIRLISAGTISRKARNGMMLGSIQESRLLLMMFCRPGNRAPSKSLRTLKDLKMVERILARVLIHRSCGFTLLRSLPGALTKKDRAAL